MTARTRDLGPNLAVWWTCNGCGKETESSRATGWTRLAVDPHRAARHACSTVCTVVVLRALADELEAGIAPVNVDHQGKLL